MKCFCKRKKSRLHHKRKANSYKPHLQNEIQLQKCIVVCNIYDYAKSENISAGGGISVAITQSSLK